MITSINTLNNIVLSATQRASEIDFFQMGYLAIGGLALFLYGMGIFSNVLQSLGSDIIKKVINYITANRVMATLVGIFVTAFVQSSSVSTVMMSGFVNSGLMTLSQGVGFIFGANIGTTITGWIISLNIGKYGLLLIGVGGIPFLFCKNEKIKIASRMIFALGMIFFGLEVMSNSFKPLRTCAEFIDTMKWFDASSYIGILACMLVGCVMTMFVQSSSAMLAITISLAVSGSIPFETAAALVLGENIGTTVTLWLASLNGGRLAKQTALAHTTFNLSGSLLILILFPWYIKFIYSIVPGDPASFYLPANEAKGIAENTVVNKEFPRIITAHIAMVHTMFNICTTIVFLPFLQFLVKFVEWAIPINKDDKELQQNKYFDDMPIFSTILAANQVQQVIHKMKVITDGALQDTKELLSKEDFDEDLAHRIADAESEADIIQQEIIIFTNKMSEHELSSQIIKQIHLFVHTTDELESITDYCLNVVRRRRQFKDENIVLNQDTCTMLTDLCDNVIALYRQLDKKFDKNIDIVEVFQTEFKKIRKIESNIKNNHLEMIQEKQYPPLFILNLSEITTALRRICNHTVNIVEEEHLKNVYNEIV